MRMDKSAEDVDLSCIPSEFRENYKFLSELIECKEKIILRQWASSPWPKKDCNNYVAS